MDAEAGRLARDESIARIEAQIDALQRPIGRAVADACRKEPELTPEARMRILVALDAAMANVYGHYPGDTRAPLFQLIVREAQALTERVLTASAADARARLAGKNLIVVGRQ
jgi:ribosomal 50S subunit-associated protein YjgA (DUF615 family)